MNQLKAQINNNLKSMPVSKASNGIPQEPCRLLNGRGGKAPGFENLNIDIYPPLVFVTVYCEYSNEQIECIGNQLREIFPDNPILIQDRSLRPAVTRLQYGVIPKEIIIEEDGLKFYLNPLRGQNPGFFSDMRAGRKFIKETVKASIEKDMENINVLNLFSYTCALSVVSIAAGASKVVNIDMNKRSLDIGKRNHRLNYDAVPGGYRSQAVFLPHDIFKSFGRLKKEGPYNLIIADPPPSQKGSFTLQKDYPRLIKRLPEMLKSEGVILLTLNSPGFSWGDFEDMINENLHGFSILKKIDPPADYAPFEDGRGLKIIIAGKK